MSMAQEMFRFVTTRPAERVAMHRINARLIRDARPARHGSMLAVLFGPGAFSPKLAAAEDFVLTPEFVAHDALEAMAHGPAVDFFRARLAPGIVLADLADEVRAELPVFAALLNEVPPDDLLEATARFLGRTWDSVYSMTTIGCYRYVSTNYLIDILRVYQVLRLLVVSGRFELETWTGGAFDDYDTLIDLDKAADGAGARTTDQTPGRDRIFEAAEAAALSGEAPIPVFKVKLEVGAVQPPTVGDLLLVQQDLQSYQLGELAKITSIMKGERREHTTRTLARTSSTTTTETLSENEETSSQTIDERFSLTSQAQQTASESFGIQAGVTVSGKFGPVQVGASVNASYDTSESSSQSTSQEYAKTVTEEATKRVKNSIKQTSSITVLTETQETTLQGYNNEKGSGHVNGLYRWVDKRYTARLLNYGRRLMFSIRVPEPSGYFRALLDQKRDKELADLVEPLHPSRIDPSNLDELPPSSTSGFKSYLDIDEHNYAELAARYDVSGIQPPPARYITGSKAIVYPEAHQAAEMPEHDFKNELSWVSADNTLTVDPDYRITEIGVYASTGGNGNNRSWADALKIGENKGTEDDPDTNLILVQVGNKSFHFGASGQGNNDPKKISTNFNEMQDIDDESDLFGDVVQGALPITVTALFEGMLTFSVLYQAKRRDETRQSWQAQTYATVLEGYTKQKQAYDQSLSVVQAQTQSATEVKTYTLREDQYRSIELTELKRGCIDLLTKGSAAGATSVSVDDDGTPTIVYDEAEGDLLNNWRSPLANGSVAEYFERVFDWADTTYEFFPYYWAGQARWRGLSQASGADPIFEKFLQSGSANVVVPVRPGFERAVMFFLKTGNLWGGGHLSLFTDPDMLAVYGDVEQGIQFDPPIQVGPTWEILLPTSMVMLQETSELPVFDDVELPADDQPAVVEPVPDADVPF